MTDDLERRLRDLLQHAQLPFAPDGLRSRLVQVATAAPARRRPAFRGRWLLLPIVAILVVALAAGLVVVGGPPSQTSVTARSGDFQLTLASSKSEYANGEKIDVSASVEYTGPNDSVQVFGTYKTSKYPTLLTGLPFVALVYFSAEQLDGPISILGTGGPTTCTDQTLKRGEPVTQPVRNDLEYYPGHPLPAGTYRVTAHASFGSSCNHPIDLSASLVVQVSKYAASPSPATPSGIYLPTVRSRVDYPLLPVEGTLIEQDGCLSIEADGDRWLVLWPSGSSVAYDGSQLVVRNAGKAAVVGTAVSSTGGQYYPQDYAQVVREIGEQVPSACRGNDMYWLAAFVEPYTGSYSLAPGPTPTPKFVTPGPTPWPSNACGGFHLKVVNEDTGSITVTINDSYTETVDGGTSQTVVEWLPPNKPLMPWTVVVTGADGTQIGSAFMTGPVDQKVIVSGGQMEYGPYDIRTDGCG